MTGPIKRGFVVGGKTAWKVTTRGDIACAFHWIAGEPTMVLYPLHRLLRLHKAVPYAIPLPAAHELVNAGTRGEGVNSTALIDKARTACRVMGMQDDWHMVKSVADSILSNLDQLIKMPPEPDWHAKREEPPPVGGVMQFRANGRVLAEKEV